jgi:hypothetical protein
MIIKWARLLFIKILSKAGYIAHKRATICDPVHRSHSYGDQIFSLPKEIKIVEANLPLTLTTRTRMVATMRGLKYISANKIAGAFVECGVWKGGQIIVGMEQLKLLDDLRDVYLYDTFAGMTEPSELDVDTNGVIASEELKDIEPAADNLWVAVSLQDVVRNLKKVEYPEEKVHYIVGDIRETLNVKDNLPEEISLLRLDTDWFDSTYRELEVLYPRLSDGGVLLIDDYGHWKGSKMAADKYFSELGIDPFWVAVDSSCVLHIKAKS